MSDKKKKILITSALPYVNGTPHLGHMVGCLLPSDVFARFNRQKGNEVLYICGTDEHGTPSELGAKKEGVSVEEYVKKYHNMHKDLYEKFGLSFDYFGRTSDPSNIETTQGIFEALDKQGLIEEVVMKQVYSIDDERFLADRYVEGTCPHCGYEGARGDQCESCTKLLDPTDLIDPRSAVSGSKNIEVRDTKHLFLKLSKVVPKLEKWIKSKKDIWDKVTYSIAQKWLSEGIHDRCITRDLKWGVPIPSCGGKYDEYAGKVFYVWFDAPIGYISMSKDAEGVDWESWWKEKSGSNDVKYYEFMGKDNVPFHSIFFPSMLIGAEQDWKLVDNLKGMSYLNFEGGKFSKSAGRGVFFFFFLEEFPADYWRYWLMANAPESNDSDFTFEKFASDINKDLNDVLGNFVSRVVKFAHKKFDGVVPEIGDETFDEFINLRNNSDDLDSVWGYISAYYTAGLKNLNYRKAMQGLRELWSLGNKLIDEKAPWSVYKEDPKKAGEILNFALNLVYLYGVLSAPIMPETSKKILGIFGKEEDLKNIWPVKTDLLVLDENILRTIKPGTKFTIPEQLFTKIDDDRLNELKEKYNSKKA